jgi:DNA-binding MarR family transcriptional regulator
LANYPYRSSLTEVSLPLLSNQQNGMDYQHTIGRYLGQLNYLMSRRLTMLLKKADTGLTTDQFRLMTHLWQQDGQSQQQLAKALGRDRAAITRMTDILEELGLLTRLPDNDDRRVNLVHLTQKGRDLETAAAQCAIESLAQLTNNFTPEEKQVFEELVLKAIRNLS